MRIKLLRQGLIESLVANQSKNLGDSILSSELERDESSLVGV